MTSFEPGKSDQPSDSGSPPARTIPDCRYRLDDSSSATITLPDGRKLGYAEYGLQDGKAIFYCHGLPGARLESAFLDAAAVRLKARIIAVDRPGYGWSSPQPGRRLLDHAKDIQHLAEYLKVEAYGVMGISGGGPYALACAFVMPADKLKAVAIVCGLGSCDMGYRGMNWFHWLGFTLGWRYTPGLACWWFSRQPEARLDLTDDERLEFFLRSSSKKMAKADPKDVAFFTDVDRMRLFLRSYREVYAQGFAAMGQDGQLLCKDFGFRIEDIRSDLPVRLWYGTRDDFVPLNHGKQIAARLGEGAHLRTEDETHASIVMNWSDQVLEDLVRSM